MAKDNLCCTLQLISVTMNQSRFHRDDSDEDTRPIWAERQIPLYCDQVNNHVDTIKNDPLPIYILWSRMTYNYSMWVA